MKEISAVKTTGGSMRPFIKSGSFLFVENLPAKQFQPGDKVLYRSEGSTFVHRIQKISLKPSCREIDHFVVTDDAAIIAPQKLYPEQVLGRPVSKLNGIAGLFAGRISNFAYSFLRKLKLYTPRLSFVFAIVIASAIFSNVYSATRIKTVEYNFGSYWSTGTVTWAAPYISINLPESGIVIKNAFLDIHYITVPALNTTNIDVFFSTGTAPGGPVDNVSAGALIPTNSGESDDMVFRADVTNQFVYWSNQPYSMSITATNNGDRNFSAKQYTIHCLTQHLTEEKQARLLFSAREQPDITLFIIM
jgi:hypothetical protein